MRFRPLAAGTMTVADADVRADRPRVRSAAPSRDSCRSAPGRSGSNRTSPSSRQCSTRGAPAPGFPARNLTPRGLILNLGRGHWVGFDTDLLRVAAMWHGNAVTPKALAPGSYHEPDRKTQGGQSPPEPDGKVWIANGIYPGWQTGARPSFDDPREPAPTADGSRPRPVSEPTRTLQGRSPRSRRRGARVHRARRGSPRVDDRRRRQRRGRRSCGTLRVGPATEPLWLVLGFKTKDGTMSACRGTGAAPVLESLSIASWRRASGAGVGSRRSRRTPSQIELCVATLRRASASTIRHAPGHSDRRPVARWPQEVTTTVTLSTAKDAYVVDDFALPVDNPWRRNVRPGDIQFLRDGTGVMRHARRRRVDGPRPSVASAFRRRRSASAAITWKRFASGLHEPLTARDQGRADPRLRPQRHLAPARHQRRRRGGRPRALLERVRADRRQSRVSKHAAPRAGRRVRHRQGRPGSDDHRQAQRQRAARLGRRPHGYRARLRVPAAADRRQRAHRPRHRQRSAGPLHPHHAAAHRQGPPVLRLSERQAAARGLPGADCRSADVDSARRERLGDVAGVAVRRADGPAQRRARAHRVQQPRALPRDAQRPRREAAGRRCRASRARSSFHRSTGR